MKIRIKFAKYSAMKYIGHLDFMRFFMKAIRRANLPIKYTSGFHPHPIMSFALPLGVGVTSSGEYLDVELLDEMDEQAILDALQKEMPEGVLILAVSYLKDTEKKAMSVVEAADYFVYYKKDGMDLPFEQTAHTLTDFLSSEQIPVEKKSKKGTRTLDLSPFIYSFNVNRIKDLSDIWIKENILSDEFCTADDDLYYEMQVSSGSSDNIKPELVISAFHSYLGLNNEPSLAVHRKELYTKEGDAFVPLIK